MDITFVVLPLKVSIKPPLKAKVRCVKIINMLKKTLPFGNEGYCMGILS